MYNNYGLNWILLQDNITYADFKTFLMRNYTS